MKTLSFVLLAGLAVFGAVQTNAQAALICGIKDPCWRIETGNDYLDASISTTLYPVLILGDNQMDLRSPEARAMVFAQADETLSGKGAAINESENVVRALARANDVSEEKMAQALKSLEASETEINPESVRQALK